MPKIFKRSGSKYYYYRMYSEGKESLVCTHEEDRKLAQSKADGHTGAVRGRFNLEELFSLLMAKLDALPQADRDRQRTMFGHRLLRLQEQKLAMVDVWDRWCIMPNRSKYGAPGESTLAGYKAIWSRFSKWATEQELLHLHEVTVGHAETYMGLVQATGVTERTFAAHLKFLRSLFRVMKNQAGIIENPFEGNLVVPKLQTQSREAFSEAELKTIFAKISGDWRYMVGIGLFTGLRLKDVVYLKWSDIADSITVTPAKVKRRKGKNAKVSIPIHPALKDLLAELRKSANGKESGYLFPSMVAQYIKARSEVSNAFHTILEKECGISPTAEKDPDVKRKRRASSKGFHSLRHTFVSMCGENGVPQHVAQALVGHSNPEMTQAYSHATSSQAQQAINRLPSAFLGLSS